MSLAENDAMRLLLHFRKILEMDSIQSPGQSLNGVLGLDTGANIVAQIGTETNAGIATLNGLEPVFKLVIEGSRTVVMDGNAHIILINQFFQTIKGIGRRVGTEVANAGMLGELEKLLVAFMVL